MLRTALKPTRLTARETVLTEPRLACANSTLLTRRSSFVRQRHVLEDFAREVADAVVLELATRWMRATESDSAGKSLLWRMRRSRKSSVALPAVVEGAHRCRPRPAAHHGTRCRGIALRRVTGQGMLQDGAQGVVHAAAQVLGQPMRSLAMRYSACQVSVWWIRAAVSSSTSTSAAE